MTTGSIRESPAAAGRARAVGVLTSDVLDVLVVGGGIVGAGIARDAAWRGLRTGLIEQRDFAFGTSSRSSRLLHGGLRYLAQGRIGLVREASVEKTVLRRIAPHLMEPLAFVFPAYRGSRWPLWQLRVGVKLYDLLCPRSDLGGSSALSREETLARLPALQPLGLTGAVRYHDGLTHDARLTIDTLRSAAAGGAAAANYFKLVNAWREGSLWHWEAEDRLTARVLRGRTRALVNATGPWADGLLHSGVRLRLTKGIHCVFDRERLPVSDAVAIAEGSRLLFVIPWGRRAIVGTTDTDYAGAPEAVQVEPGDRAYLLGSLNSHLPGLAVREADMLASWAGVRPLIAHSNGAPSDLSRAHRILSPQPGWWDVAGGKLTTYRLMAEQTLDQVLGYLGGAARPCCTADRPLLESAAETAFSAVTPPPVTAAAVRHFCAEESAWHLDDVLRRRTGWSYYEPDPDEAARLVAGWMAEFHGWSPAQEAAELARYRRQAGRPELPPCASPAGRPSAEGGVRH